MSNYTQKAQSFRSVQDTTVRDIDLLVGIASMLYLYRKMDKALGVLAVAEHIYPYERTILEFKAVILADIRDYLGVLDTIRDIEAVASPIPDELEKLKRQARRVLAPRRNMI